MSHQLLDSNYVNFDQWRFFGSRIGSFFCNETKDWARWKNVETEVNPTGRGIVCKKFFSSLLFLFIYSFEKSSKKKKRIFCCFQIISYGNVKPSMFPFFFSPRKKKLGFCFFLFFFLDFPFSVEISVFGTENDSIHFLIFGRWEKVSFSGFWNISPKGYPSKKYQ